MVGFEPTDKVGEGPRGGLMALVESPGFSLVGEGRTLQVSERSRGAGDWPCRSIDTGPRVIPEFGR